LSFFVVFFCSRASSVELGDFSNFFNSRTAAAIASASTLAAAAKRFAFTSCSALKALALASAAFVPSFLASTVPDLASNQAANLHQLVLELRHLYGYHQGDVSIKLLCRKN
jgi:hypothetical protein